MSLVFLDRAQQTGTANTTVSFTLTGAVLGFQSLSGVGNGNTSYYGATDTLGNWESGIGTYATGGIVTRTTILESSNSNTAVTFSGTVNVFVTYPNKKAVYLDSSGNLSASASLMANVPSTNLASTNVQSAINETTVFAITKANAAQAASAPVGHVHAIATTSVDGFLSASDKTKLNAITGTNTGDQTTITGNAGSSSALKSATTTVLVSASIAPTIGQVLTATSATNATWQVPSSNDAIVFALLFGAE